MSRPARLTAGAGLAFGLHRLLTAHPPGGAERWQRINHRGRPVSLLPGPCLALAATVTAGLPLPAAAVAGLGSAAVGGYDDVVGSRAEQRSDKGLTGHLTALRSGRITAGAVKVVGIGTSGLLAARLLAPRRSPTDVALDGALVAVAANLLNLLDLRPGRALKVGLLSALALSQPGPAGAAAALLPDDLTERGMLGDAGANGLGALLGLAAAARWPTRPPRLAALAGGLALTLASERVSFSAVIDEVPSLRWADRLGRRP